jgi:hypothetical protein
MLPTMARRWPVNPLVHLRLLVEEASRRVGDRREVVAHLVDHDAPDAEGDALVGHAVDGELGLAEVEGEPAHGLHARDDQRALAGDDLEAEALVDVDGGGPATTLDARDDERLVRLGDAPHELEDDDGRHDGDGDGDQNDHVTPAFDSHLGDDDRSRGEVLHDHDASARLDHVLAVRGICVKRLGAAAHRDHDFADHPRGDPAGHPADLAHHLMVSHAASLGLVEAECRVRIHG